MGMQSSLLYQYIHLAHKVAKRFKRKVGDDQATRYVKNIAKVLFTNICLYLRERQMKWMVGRRNNIENYAIQTNRGKYFENIGKITKSIKTKAETPIFFSSKKIKIKTTSKVRKRENQYGFHEKSR